MEEIEKLNDQYVDLMKNMADKIVKKDALQEQLENAKKELKALGVTKENYKEKTADEQKEWRAKNGEVLKVKNELESLQGEIEKIAENTRALKDQLIEMYPEIKKYVGELTKKAAERNLKKVEEGKSKLETKKDKINTFKEMYKNNLGVKADVKAILANTKKIEDLKNKKEKLESDKKKLNAIFLVKGNPDKVAKLKKEIAALEPEVEGFDQKVADLEKDSEQRKGNIFNCIDNKKIDLTHDDVESILQSSAKLIGKDEELTLDQIMDRSTEKLDKSIEKYDRKIEKIIKENGLNEPKKENEEKGKEPPVQDDKGTKANDEKTPPEEPVQDDSDKNEPVNDEQQDNENEGKALIEKRKWYQRIGDGFKKAFNVMRHPIQAIKNRAGAKKDIEVVEEETKEPEQKEPETKTTETKEPETKTTETKTSETASKSNLNAKKFREAQKYEIFRDVSKELSGEKLNLDFQRDNDDDAR